MPDAVDNRGTLSPAVDFHEAGNPAFAAEARLAAQKAGKHALTDHELLVLAAHSLARTYTREERRYQ